MKNIIKIGILTLALSLAVVIFAVPVQGYTVRHAKQNLASQRAPRPVAANSKARMQHTPRDASREAP